MQGVVQGTIGGLGLLGSHAELVVETGQEIPQDGGGLVDGFGVSQTEFGHQPVLEGSRGPFHASLGLRRASKDLLDAQLLHGSAGVSGLHRRLDVLGLPENLNTPCRSS